MPLALIGYGSLAILAGLALVAIAPAHARLAHVMPAVRTTALLLVAAVYVAALWGH
ncbi:hypothetical protein [Streptomyces sp.]|uniref:hypothetical protein n=1 Tax=Streptomyces sp. TaxID=1931 RepID=UPI002F9555F4